MIKIQEKRLENLRRERERERVEEKMSTSLEVGIGKMAWECED